MTPVIPGPRPSTGLPRPDGGRDGGPASLRAAPSAPIAHNRSVDPRPDDDAGYPPVALTRTSRGWSVVSPAGAEDVSDLIEGLSLADLVAEEFGALAEPDRSTRRSARGPAVATSAEDPVDARIAALERTVAQLEHALAARVSTERAIGVLAERNGCEPRAAFETLRRDARSQGRPVAELAREVLDAMVGPAVEPVPLAVAAAGTPVPRLPESGAAPTGPLRVDGSA
jgi:hypothetical protein